MDIPLNIKIIKQTYVGDENNDDKIFIENNSDVISVIYFVINPIKINLCGMGIIYFQNNNL